MGRMIVQNGLVVSETAVTKADVVIEGEQIAGVVRGARVEEGDEVIDATGMLVLPGIVDAHTHIKLDTGIYQTADTWEIGTKAAAAGGVTTVIDFANQIPGMPFKAALDARCQEAADAIIDYSFHMVVLDAAQDPNQLATDLQSIVDLGIPSIKLFTTYRPNYYVDDATLLRIFQNLPDGLLAMIHCENDSIVTAATEGLVAQGKTALSYHAQGRPPEAEIEAINRVITLAGFPAFMAAVYIAHCSTSDSVWDVNEWRGKLANVACETCPQYLLLDESVYTGDRPERYILQPPLRSAEDREALRAFVREGLIDVISTDTCDYTIQQKTEHNEFTQTPGGLPGIETLLPLMYTLFVDELAEPVETIIRLMTANPARIFGLYPQKGVLLPGSDADVVIYDPQPEKTIRHEDLHYLAGYSPYEGKRVKGEVKATISRGEVIYRAAYFTEQARAGRGRFVPGERI